jgi:spermidine synthase
VKRIRSKYSGVLEISYDRGQKVLDSKNTSYSYGNLQRVWDKALQEISIKDTEHILILGMGGGSSIVLLREKYGYKGKITAIELDPVIVQIADEEFDIRNSRDLKIHNMDAVAYVKKRVKKSDLILIDIFIDALVPPAILTYDFWKNTASRTAVNGHILFNAFTNDETLQEICGWLEQWNFQVKIKTKVNGANTILYAQRMAK